MTISPDSQKLDRTSSEGLSETSSRDESTARREAINQIQRKRHFHVELVASGIGMALLVLIWATTEYHNAGGWPTQGFSESSGIHDVWNYWIIYPVGAWVLIMAGRAWSVYAQRGISEGEIQWEMEHQKGKH
jgi:2TM domain